MCDPGQNAFLLICVLSGTVEIKRHPCGAVVGTDKIVQTGARQWWLRVRALEPNCLHSNPDSAISKLCNPGYVPQFPRLKKKKRIISSKSYEQD